MKTLRLAILFMFIAATLCNCAKNKVSNEDNNDLSLYDESINKDVSYMHWLWLSFRDASENDLTKGIYCEEGKISISPDLYYALDIIYPYGRHNPWYPEPAPIINGVPAWVLDEPNPKPIIYFMEGKHAFEWGAVVNSDYNYLLILTKSYKYENMEGNIFPCVEKITFKLTFPSLFGDDLEHDIVTWWELIENILSPVCYRIEYNGKEFPVEEKYVATIVLER